MRELVVNRLVVHRFSSFGLENALEALQRMLKVNPTETLEFIGQREELMLALVNLVHDANEKVCMLALGLLVYSTGESD